MTAPNPLNDLIRQIIESQKKHWNHVDPLGSVRRGDESAVMKYYAKIDGMCDLSRTTDHTGAAPPATTPTPQGQDVIAFVSAVDRQWRTGSAAPTGANDPSRARRQRAGTTSPRIDVVAAVKNVAAQEGFKANAEVQALAKQIIDSRDPQQAFDVATNSVTEAMVEKSIIGPRGTAGRRRRSGLSESDWNVIADRLRCQFAARARGGLFPCTTLLYCYWLDEAGVQWAVERAAFRAENGDENVTGSWPVFNLTRDADLVGVLAGYITAWQRGDLAALQERQQMYYALYGYPLYIAARGRPLRTPDPRHAFPGAFNNFLSAAMKYYEQERNLNFVPNIAAARGAFDQLALALKEGDQNMRDFRPPELRAQFEYLKDVLGDEPSDALAETWKQVLQGRPGLIEQTGRWTWNCDAIAEANKWRRPHARNYRTLAENGEIILVMARLFDAAFAESVDPAQMEAFIQSMRGPIHNYVEAFQAVCGVNLERDSVAMPPAPLMAKRYPPPQDAPWPRYWEPTHAIPA